MKLLYRTAEWHGLAKLRMHTETTLALLEALTSEFGQLAQSFQELTCSHFAPTERSRDMDAGKNDSTRPVSQAATLGGSTTQPVENRIEPTSSANPSRKCWSYLRV